MAELPDLVEVGRDFADRGGRVIGISQDLMVPDKAAEGVVRELESFLAERDLQDFPVFVFDEDTLDGLNEHFDLPGPIPVTLALDADGRIVDRHEGDAGAERFSEMMRKALGLDSR